jgi:hypothetical protein
VVLLYYLRLSIIVELILFTTGGADINETFSVMPAKAGIQSGFDWDWMPAFAGMTEFAVHN